MPVASHCSTTGVTVSGVEATMSMSTFALLIRSPATWEARDTSDWLSWTSMATACFLPSPPTMPSPMNAFHLSTQYVSGTPKDASGPVSGVTKPSLTSSPISALGRHGSRGLTARGGSGGRAGGGACRCRGGGGALFGLAACCQQASESRACPDGDARDARHLEEVAAADGLLRQLVELVVCHYFHTSRAWST